MSFITAVNCAEVLLIVTPNRCPSLYVLMNMVYRHSVGFFFCGDIYEGLLFTIARYI